MKNKRKKLMKNKEELYVYFHLFLSQILKDIKIFIL